MINSGRRVAAAVVMSVSAGESDEELIRCDVVADPEGRLEGPSLRRRQGADAVEERGQELVQGREPEPHLGLDADQPDDVEVRRRRRHGVEQARLADPGLSPHDEHTAQTRLAPARGDDRSRPVRPPGRRA